MELRATARQKTSAFEKDTRICGAAYEGLFAPKRDNDKFQYEPLHVEQRHEKPDIPKRIHSIAVRTIIPLST
jgi:hypothetical protein